MEGAPRSEGRGARFWLIVVLVAIGVLFCAVNFQKVTVDFVVGEAIGIVGVGQVERPPDDLRGFAHAAG